MVIFTHNVSPPQSVLMPKRPRREVVSAASIADMHSCLVNDTLTRGFAEHWRTAVGPYSAGRVRLEYSYEANHLPRMTKRVRLEEKEKSREADGVYLPRLSTLTYEIRAEWVPGC